jgi:DNA invertase Pin-like site-specific DNA recombinase
MREGLLGEGVWEGFKRSWSAPNGALGPRWRGYVDYRDLLGLLDTIKAAGATIKALDDTWLDTTSAHGELIITIMGGLAEFERKLIRARCDEGIKRAKARGTVFGRKPVLDAGERRKIAERYSTGETMAELARDYNCGVATIHRVLQPTHE